MNVYVKLSGMLFLKKSSKSLSDETKCPNKYIIIIINVYIL